jgi:hypothetical protein
LGRKVAKRKYFLWGDKNGIGLLNFEVKHGMKENLKMALFLELVLLLWKIVEDMKECGKIKKWMDLK